MGQISANNLQVAQALQEATRTPQSNPATAAAIGNFRGEAVTLPSIQQSLANAAEELTFSVAERNSSDLAKRKVQDGLGGVSEAFALADEYLKKVPDIEKQQRLKDFAAGLSQQNVATARQLQAYMDSFSRDVSHQFLALSFAREFLAGKGGNEALLALIDEAMGRLTQEKGPEIRAGINVSAVALQYQQDAKIGDIQGLRDFYRDTVLGYMGLAAAYRDIAKRFGVRRMRKAIKFMLSGLSADLAANGSSIDEALLQQIMSDMYKLKVLNGLYSQVEDMFATLGIEH